MTDSREAHAAEVSQLTAARDALGEQSAAQRVQQQRQTADLETLRQDLAAALEGGIRLYDIFITAF